MLGLKKNLNRLADYDPRWEAAFIDECEQICAALSGVAQGVEHIGSTSVTGMRAKPILDIMIGVTPFENWRLCQTPLAALGYDYVDDAGVAAHRIFGRGRDETERTHLIHVVAFMGDAWRSDLAFRDALRADPALRDAYMREKERAIAAAPDSRIKYNEAKGPFIAAIKATLK